MIKQQIDILIVCLTLMGLVGCGTGDSPAAGQAQPKLEKVTLFIAFHDGLGKPLFASGPGAVNSIQISVSGSDLSTTTRLLVRDADFSGRTNLKCARCYRHWMGRGISTWGDILRPTRM